MDSKSKNAIIWTAIERFSVQGVQFVLGLVIARILSPDDYGLVAMLGIFTAVAQSFVDSGFGSALIQKRDRTDVDYTTVFFFNLLVSILCYLILCFSAGAIARFYEQPELVLITRVVGINLIVNACSLVQRTKLTVELRYSLIAKITLVATLIAGVSGLVMAYRGWGVWTLVFQVLILNVITMVLMSLFSGWRPKLIFSMESFRSLFAFGSKLLVGGLMHTIYVNLYSLVIGKRFEATELGLFNRSYSLASIFPINMTGIMERTFYPIGCGFQDDNERLRVYFIKNIRLASLVIFPVMLIFAVLARPVVIIILSEKWADLALYLPILCIAYMWDVIMRLNWNILSIKGRTDLALKSEVIKKVVSVIILFATMPFGLTVMCYGLVLYSLLDIWIITRFTARLGVVTCSEEARNVAPFLVAALIAVIPAFFIDRIVTNDYWTVLFGTLSASLVYVALLLLFRNDETIALFGKLKNRLKP